ncbi:helix-turn-helix domain-containing protein [Zoogloea sp. LCSB751]|uniref:helix-turn-helix domain-containing protein n=1 Tax=Zoogloea sp. LCSB751 TaxID=1965277 RepID=UPI0013747D5E|nr:helix-turn-helix domain-containing protein [Zoogloea sp. LCSB751]
MIQLQGSPTAPQALDAPDYLVSTRVTTDAGEQANCLRGWSQQYEQLVPGTFEGRVTEICFDGLQLFREHTTLSIQESCQIQDDAFVIGVPVQMDGYSWCDGWEVDLDTLLMHKLGSESLLRTSNNLDLIAVTLSLQDLRDHAATVDGQDISAALQRSGSALRNGMLAREMRDFLVTMMASLTATPSMLAHGAIRKALKEAVLGTAVSLIGNVGQESTGPRTSVGRQQIVARAIDYMRTRIDEPISVGDLCAELGVSRRTLQYCFDETLQINPLSYLKALRLNGVRKELRLSEPARVAVQDVAARWGFWHLSRFAQEYRHMFGELPSETLRASPGEIGALLPERH